MLIQENMNLDIQHYILQHFLEIVSCVIFYLWQVLKVRQPIQLDVLLLKWQLLWVRALLFLQGDYFYHLTLQNR